MVLAILGLLAAIATPQLIKHFGTAKRDAARVQVDRVATILDLYHLEVGNYPAQEEGLKALVERPPSAASWNGPYLKKADSLLDPWGREYLYRFPGQHGTYDLYSLGADGQEGGAGENQDIVNW